MTTTMTKEAPTNEIAACLRPVLVDLIALALNAKQAHWHVRGKTFIQVHEQLDSLVSDARNYADEIAERLVALGSEVDGRPAYVAAHTDTPEFPTGFQDCETMVGAIVEQLDATIKRARQAVDPLDELDPVTQDIVIETLRGLDKHRWMFAAQVS